MSAGERLAAALASVAGRAGPPVEVALILGSGLGGLAEAVEPPVAIPYARDRGLPGLDRAGPRRAAGDRRGCMAGGWR